MAVNGVQRVRIDMTGLVFGELHCLSFAGRGPNNGAKWLARCSCGVVKAIDGYGMRVGKIISCGHIKATRGAVNQFKHGHSRRSGKTAAYRCWRNMLARCYDPKSQRYKNYGARGIRVCEEWRSSFAVFLNDMGEPPEDKSIERIDVHGDYKPCNCTWATDAEQRANTTRSPKNRRHDGHSTL